MTTSNRTSLIKKIQALLAKTTAKGCTEAEAMSALGLAQKLMDEYEVTDADLELKGEEAQAEDVDAADPHKIRFRLNINIGLFCDVKIARNRKTGVDKFVGLQSDIELAKYLMDSLEHFIKHQLAWHLGLFGHTFKPGTRGVHIKSFVAGCISRINERLAELIKARKTSTNKNALMVIKTDLIAKKMNEVGWRSKTTNVSQKHTMTDSYRYGSEAGKHASFGRPVGQGGPVLRIGRTK